MNKRLLSLLLMLALLLCAATGLGEQVSSLSTAKINALQKLAGDAGTPLSEGARPTQDMTAFQAWQWTDRFLAGQVRSLLGTIQSYDLLDSNNSLDLETENVQWELLELENTLSHFESKLEEDRLAILNGIELYQSGEGSEDERQKAVSRTLEAESEIKQIISTICGEYKTYLDQVNVCSNKLDNQNAEAVLNGRLEALTAEADAIASIENAANADFTISVVSRHQFKIQVMDTSGKAISGAQVTATNRENTAKTKTLATNSSGNAIFLVSDMGADETKQMQLTLRITASGYRTREVKKVKLYGGDSTTLYLEQDDGKPYLIMSGFSGCDILTEKSTFYYSPKNDYSHAISAKLSSATDGTLELHYLYDGKDTVESKAFKASDSDKTEFVFEKTWLSILQPGTKVFFKIITKDKQEYTFDTQLDIQKAVVDEPFLSESSTLFKFFGGDGGFGFDIPTSVPFIGGSRLAVSIPGKAPKLMILPSGRAMFAWGATYSSKDASWKSDDTQDIEKAQKEFDAKSTADRLLAKAGAYRDVNTSTEPKMLGSFGASVNPFVSLQGSYSTTEHELSMNGSVGATLAFKAAFTQTFTFGPVPFFAGVDFSMGASFGLEADVEMKMELVNGVLSATDDPTIKYIDGKKSGFSINIRLELGGTIGLGLQDVASVALRGYGYLNPIVDLAVGGVSANAKYGMGIGVTVRVLFLKWQYTLISKEEDLGQSNSAMTLSAPSDGTYTHFDSTDAQVPLPPMENSVTNGSSGVEPTTTTQVFSQIDSATGNFQYAVIGDQTYLFWIQPGTATGWNKVGARLMWYNLNDTSKHGEVNYLSQNSIGNANSGENGSTTKRGTYADYDFAVEVSRGLNNQGSSFCALTILSGMFTTGTGSGTSPEAPDDSVLTTVLMKQNANKGLDIVFYQEYTRVFRKEDYAVMPEVFLTAWGDDEESVYIISTCSSSSERRDIYGQVIYNEQNGLDGLQPFDSNAFVDGYGINRYHVGIPDAAQKWPDEKVNIYSLNQNGELSRLSYPSLKSTRDLLATGDIVNFRVYSQLDENGTKDRLFYLERDGLKDGKYIHKLKCITVDLYKLAEKPVYTDFEVEINADQFDIVKFGTGVYLYWTECSTPDPANAQTQAKYMVRCLRYDPGTDTVCGPFNMVELSESPNTIKLQDSGTGFYSVDLQNSQGSYVRQSFSKFTYKLVSSAELTTATPKDNSVCAGDYVEIVFSAKNTGNVPLSGFDVQIKNGSAVIQTLHIDCANPVENSSTVNSANGEKVMSGAYTVSRISGMYDALNNDSWEITRTDANGATTVQSVQTAMLMPGDTHYYEAKMLVPSTWSGDMNLTAEISGVQGDIAVNGTMENGVLMLTGADAPQTLEDTNEPIMIERLSTKQQTFNTDVHDLALSARIFKLNGEDYVRVNVKNLSGNTASSVTPVLTSVYSGTTLFTHQFVRSMGDDFGYSMDIPLRELTQDRSLQVLDLYVGANGNYDEYANSDNHVRLLLITQLCIIEQPVSIPASAGQEAVFTVTAAGGKAPYSYQWQRMVGPDRWEDIPGARQDTYRIESVKEDQNGLTVRCVVTDQFKDYVLSDSATLTLLPQTGDSSQLALWLLLAVASAAVLVLVYRKARRR